MAWGPQEWSALASGLAAIATAVAGGCALLAARWTVRAIQEQVKVQKEELSVLKADREAAWAREWCTAAYTMVWLSSDMSTVLNQFHSTLPDNAGGKRNPLHAPIPADLSQRIHEGSRFVAFLNGEQLETFRKMDLLTRNDGLIWTKNEVGALIARFNNFGGDLLQRIDIVIKRLAEGDNHPG